MLLDERMLGGKCGRGCYHVKVVCLRDLRKILHFSRQQATQADYRARGHPACTGKDSGGPQRHGRY
jgi:hypothetical protein